jgi:pimeloyl-ACP methyl ester carboxylesterase
VTDPPRVRSEWVAIPGVTGARPLRIHCRVAGSSESAGPPVVLVQGFGIGSRYFEPLQRQVARYAPVYAPDLPGHGRSDHDRRPLTIPQLAGALAAWMQIRGLDRAVLTGHSLGCQVVAELASRREDLIAGLVLLSPTTDPEARTVARLFARAAASALYEAPTLFLWLARDYARAGPRLLLAEMRQLLEHRVEDLLPTLPGPIRVVRGSRDRVVPQAWAETVARLSCAPPPRVVDGVAHAVQYAAPQDIAAIVREVVRGGRSEP